jgi:hypothetical protein
LILGDLAASAMLPAPPRPWEASWEVMMGFVFKPSKSISFYQDTEEAAWCLKYKKTGLVGREGWA